MATQATQKTKMTEDRFIAELTRIKNSKSADWRQKAQVLIDETEVTDGAGNAVDIQHIELFTEAQTEPDGDEGTANPADAGKADTERKAKAKADDDRITKLEVELERTKAALAKTRPVSITTRLSPARDTAEPEKVPATAKAYGRLKAFTGDDGELTAYRFGKWFQSLVGNKSATEYCEKHGIQTKAMGETNNAAGGSFVPLEFEPTLIRLVEDYGVFRRNSMVIPMTRDTCTVPRRLTKQTAYWVGEGATITQSDLGTDSIQLTAKKLAIATAVSNELNDDSIIPIMDLLAMEMAWNFAYQEDLAGFKGDGTSTYGGILGLYGQAVAISSTIAYRASTQVVAAAVAGGFGGIVAADIFAWLGRIPAYAYRMGQVKIYCSMSFYHGVLRRIMASYARQQEYADGVPTFEFQGIPVEITQVLPRVSTTASEYVAWAGNLALASKFGNRKQTSIVVDPSILVLSDQLLVRATERLDINVHDLGDANATASSQNPGPMVALAMSAS